MGSDDLYHKRKAKKISEPAVKSIKRSKRVLIVCEGTKTEPSYFKNLRKHFRINKENFEIRCDCGSDPKSVVEHGNKLFKEEKKNKGFSFDKVYFVFDRDQYHLEKNGCNYQDVLDKINHLNTKNKVKDVFVAINSVPCFEFWLLLHYTDQAPLYTHIEGHCSAGDCVKNRLKFFWPDYDKADEKIFEHVLKIDNDNMQKAIKRSKIILNNAISVDDENPSTRMHELVEYLLNMRNKN